MIERELMHWSNLALSFSYFLISGIIVYYVHNSSIILFDSAKGCFRDSNNKTVSVIKLGWFIACLFAASIFLCGTTHMLSFLRVSVPDLQCLVVIHAVAMIACTLGSLFTAIACFRFFPFIFTILHQFEVNSDGSFRHAETYLVEAVDMIKESIVLMADDFVIERGNDVSKYFFGPSYVGTSFIRYIHPEDSVAFQETVANAVNSSVLEPVTIEIRIKRTAIAEPQFSAVSLKQVLATYQRPSTNRVHCEDSSRSSRCSHLSTLRARADTMAPMMSHSSLFCSDDSFNDCSNREDVNKEDHYIWIECTMCKGKTLTKGGEFEYHLRLVSRNIDDRKKSALYQSIVEDNAEIDRVNEAKMRYISCIAHDLKTPLQSFSFSLDLLEHTELYMEQRELVQQANVAVDLMKLTISQTMDISKALTGAKLMPRRTAVFLSSVVERIKVIIAGYTKQVPLTFTIDNNVCDEIITDEEWLWQMLLNLLTNACKYTDRGEIRVRISICSEESLQRDVQLQKTERTPNAWRNANSPKSKYAPTLRNEVIDTLLCEVIDTGVGISSDKMSHIFDAFAQVQSGQVTGTGLGLFGVRTRAEGLLGSVGARRNTESSTGTGTVLWFAIPYTPNVNGDIMSLRSTSGPVGRSASAESPGDDNGRAIYVAAENVRSIQVHGSPFSSFGPMCPPLMQVPSVGTSISQRSDATTPVPYSPHTPYPVNSVPYKTEELIRNLKLTAMVVEDTASVRKLMEKLLTKMGFASVQCYENGSKGLEAMMAGQVDIVFSDVQMPIMTGPEMVRRFRDFESESFFQGERDRRQLVVAVTANSAECAELGAHGFDEIFPKPLQRSDIYGAVNQYFAVRE